MAQQIKKTLTNIEKTHFEMIMQISYVGEFEEDFPGWTKSWLESRIKDLYILILAYLEAKQMTYLMTLFQTKFQEIVNQNNKLLDIVHLDPEGEPELLLTTEFRTFLEPFKFFDYQTIREDETIKLVSILKNTDFIIKNAEAKIVREADLYKHVRWVLELYYPSIRRLNKASFIQKFKSYHPDILIPELKTAIEYKYLNKASYNIDDYIDQIRNDATNYTGDYQYENFIAVLYIEDVSIATPESIALAWKAKKFPNNWELVTVIGSPNKKKKVNLNS